MIWQFFESGGQVAIYDANNGIKAVRQGLAERFDKAGIHVILLGQNTPSVVLDRAHIDSRPLKKAFATIRRSLKATSEA